MWASCRKKNLPPASCQGFCIRAMRGSQGLSDHSYRIAMGHFSRSNPPKGLRLLNKVKSRVWQWESHAPWRESVWLPVATSNNILKLEAAAQAYTYCLLPFALSLTSLCLGRPQTAPIVRCGRPSSCLWEPLIDGISEGDMWPIGHILLRGEHYRLRHLKKELAIPPNPWGVSGPGDWELLAAGRGSRVVGRTLWRFHRHHRDNRRRRGLELEARAWRRRSNPSLQ